MLLSQQVEITVATGVVQSANVFQHWSQTIDSGHVELRVKYLNSDIIVCEYADAASYPESS